MTPLSFDVDEQLAWLNMAPGGADAALRRIGVLHDLAYAALLDDVPSFMRFKCPDVPTEIDPFVFERLMALVEQAELGRVREELLHLSLEQRYRLYGLKGALNQSWKDSRRPKSSMALGF